MPEGGAIFETVGDWENYSTPARDLRLLLAMDELIQYPRSVAANPDLFRIPAGTAWDTGMWVHPDHRLGRAFSALVAALGEWMGRQGVAGSYSRIADYNLASLTAHRRLGARMLGHFGVLKVGNWQWCAQGRPRLIRIDGGQRSDYLVPQTPSP